MATISKSTAAPRLKKRSYWGEIWHRLTKNKIAMVSLFVVIAICFISIFANFVAPYDYAAQDYGANLQYPSLDHPLGTDNFGRDLLSRIIHGGRISLLVALLSVLIALVVGSFFGATAGYFGGKYETVVMRVMDILMAIPQFLLAVSVSAAMGGGVVNTAIAIGVGAIPGYTRIMRAQVLTVKDQEFIEAARCSGCGKMRIIFNHVIPNSLSPIIVSSTLRIGASILQISSLSFIGLGVRPPTPEWGSIMAAGREFLRNFWPIVTFPGIAIMITLIAFNLLGDGLRDAMDPRMKQ